MGANIGNFVTQSCMQRLRSYVMYMIVWTDGWTDTDSTTAFQFS